MILKWEGDNMKDTKKKIKNLAFFIPTVTAILSSCSKSVDISSTNSSTSINSSTTISVDNSSSSSDSSRVNTWIEAKVITKPTNTEVVDLKDVYRVGDTLDFSINNQTGNELIVKINDTIVLPNSNNRYSYVVKDTDESLMIKISENIVIIKPQFNYYPAEYAKCVSVKFLAGNAEQVLQNDELLLSFSKQAGYSFKSIKINGVEQLLKLSNDMLSYRVADDATELIFDIEVSYDQTTVKFNVTSNDANNYVISGYKSYYQANEKVTLTVTPKEYYTINTVTLNDTPIDGSSISADSQAKVYTFNMPSAYSEVTLNINIKPKSPIVRGDILLANETTGVPTAVSKVPGMKVQCIDNNLDNAIIETTDVICQNNATSYIISLNADDDNQYLTTHKYTLKVLIPDGNSYKTIATLNNLSFSETNYSQSIVLTSGTDLSFTGEYDLPILPVTLNKNESSKDLDNGNNVMISSKKNNVSVSMIMQYTGKLFSDDNTLITSFDDKTSDKTSDLEIKLVLKDSANKENYNFSIFHNKTTGKYYATHNLTNLMDDTEISESFIKALVDGKLKVTISRVFSSDISGTNTYTYSAKLNIVGSSEEIELTTFTRSSASTYIGSTIEMTNLFNNDENKGDLIISTYHISCND